MKKSIVTTRSVLAAAAALLALSAIGCQSTPPPQPDHPGPHPVADGKGGPYTNPGPHN